MTAVDVAGQSKTPPPPANPPSRPPKTPPPPSKPPKQDADDAIFLAVALLRVDLARPPKTAPPSKPPRKPINTKPIRWAKSPARQGHVAVAAMDPVSTPGGPVQDVPAVRARDDGRAVGADGAATFSTPVPPGPPRFGAQT